MVTNIDKEFNCPVEATLQIIGGKYKSIILWYLLGGPKRYSHLQRAIPQATNKMLSQQLRDLESTGIVLRQVFPEVPPHTEYSLTELGETLRPLLKTMCQWGEDHMADHIAMAK